MVGVLLLSARNLFPDALVVGVVEGVVSFLAGDTELEKSLKNLSAAARSFLHIKYQPGLVLFCSGLFFCSEEHFR